MSPNFVTSFITISNCAKSGSFISEVFFLPIMIMQLSLYWEDWHTEQQNNATTGLHHLHVSLLFCLLSHVLWIIQSANDEVKRRREILSRSFRRQLTLFFSMRREKGARFVWKSSRKKKERDFSSRLSFSYSQLFIY